MNYEDVDLTTFIKTLAHVTNKNYIIDGNLKGKVTIHSTSLVSPEERLAIFDSVLLLKGYTTVPVSQNTVKVVAVGDAKSTTIPLVLEPEGVQSDTLVTQFLRLRHVAAEDMQTVLQQFISSGGVINSFSGTNALIVIDSGCKY